MTHYLERSTEPSRYTPLCRGPACCKGCDLQGAGLQQRHWLWQGGGAIKYSPKQLKGTNCPHLRWHLAVPPSPAGIANTQSPKGTLETREIWCLEKKKKKKNRWMRSVHGEMCQYLDYTDSCNRSPQTRSLCNDEDYN